MVFNKKYHILLNIIFKIYWKYKLNIKCTYILCKCNNAPGEVSSALLHLRFRHLTKTFPKLKKTKNKNRMVWVISLSACCTIDTVCVFYYTQLLSKWWLNLQKKLLLNCFWDIFISISSFSETHFKFLHKYFQEKKRENVPFEFFGSIEDALLYSLLWLGQVFLFPSVTGQKSAGLTIIAVDLSEYPEPFQ